MTDMVGQNCELFRQKKLAMALDCINNRCQFHLACTHVLFMLIPDSTSATHNAISALIILLADVKTRFRFWQRR